MNIKYLTWVHIFIVFCSYEAYANDQINKKLIQLSSQENISIEKMGIYLYDLDTKKTIFKKNEGKFFNPASLTKLITTFSSLEILGPNYQWKTEIYIRGIIDRKTLNGDLIIKGYGDPNLNLENFWLLLSNITQYGINKINGNVILDRTHFNVGDFDPSAFDNRPLRPYNIGPDALLLNKKSVKISFKPDFLNKRILITSFPTLENLNIVNNLRFSRQRCFNWPIEPNIKKNNIIFNGFFSHKCGERTRYYSILKPNIYFEELFKKIWKDVGGEFNGKVQVGQRSEKDKLIFTHKSENLSEIIRHINKFSSNVMARNLFLSLGDKTNIPPLTIKMSKYKLETWLLKNNIDPSSVILKNGSGLSRTSKVTPQSLNHVLIKAWVSPFMPEFISSLPLIGLDGTMKKYLKEEQYVGKGHLKTGLLKGVRGIAGYLKTNHGNNLTIVFMVNHFNESRIIRLQNNFLKWLIQQNLD